MPDLVILCVDDEKIVLNSLKRELKENFGDQYLYEMAENAGDALELIEELVQDGASILVMISDWLMPGIKGDELLMQVHAQYPQIVTVMLTGQADRQAIERAKEHANLHRCLYKPWTTEALVEAIRSGLQRYAVAEPCSC